MVTTQDAYIETQRKLIAEVKAVWPKPTDPPTTTPPPQGKVNPFTKPVIYDLRNDYGMYGISQAEATKIITSRFENRDGGQARYIVNHIQDGTTPGSLQWWARGAGVQASSTVMANRDGSLLRIVPEQHGPWTSGDVCSPTPKSAGIRALGGNPNQWSLSLEAEGKPGDVAVTYTDAQLKAILWQFADWMIRYDMPLANVISHASLNQCSRPRCPGEKNMLAVVDGLRQAGFS
ncbi:MAG: N-acetylmuramoyl-L-alanine amidase [Desulfurellales bacterium]|nr:MAG: N-acetylmuramoyl-L-alanine amidase [Desulfurellales bacterium]